jgi:hypothetical protein
MSSFSRDNLWCLTRNSKNYNIKTGAAFIKSMLGEYDGSVLLVIGHYNGWFAGMTYVSVPPLQTGLALTLA